jgi:hypothetical protein
MRALILLLASIIVGTAQAATPVIPANLDAWRGWVLKDQEFRACPLLAGSSGNAAAEFVCSWPGALSIHADAGGAVLDQRWQLDIDGWVALAGDHAHWPQQVTVDGKVVAVVDRGGPMLWMAAGTHELRARMSWSERPQAMQVPASIARIALTVDGKTVAPLQRSGNQLTLGRGPATAVEADSIDLRVFRKFTDDIPGQLSTEIRFYVSGQAREEVIGPVLPEGFVPLALGSQQWSARLDDEGLLHVQVQPGTNTVSLSARASAPIDKLVAHLPKRWAAQEIWSYESVAYLRVTNISGAVQVDPRQADVPNAWSNLPAYAMNDGDTLNIEQRSRGLDDKLANRLSLRREAWLNFSGDGWFARDRIHGQMLSGWRFDLSAPFLLQRAQDSGSADDALLITKGASAGLSGVEWRNPSVNLSAGIRIDSAKGSMLVSGWQQVFDQVSTTLHLPYGYRLIAAPGSDLASGSWMSQWTLLDIFLVAIIILVAARLLGPVGGGLTAVYLLLGYQEINSPLWSLLIVLVLSLIAEALPKGRLSRVAGGLRIAAYVVLLIIAVPFAAHQLRLALYPQLEPPAFSYGVNLNSDATSSGVNLNPDGLGQVLIYPNAPAPSMAPPPPPQAADEVQQMESSVSRSSPISRGGASNKAAYANQGKIKQRYSQSTVVQTGSGEPGWQLGSRYELSWSGPVLPDQEVHLVIASPWLIRMLRVVLAAVLAAMLWNMLGTQSRWRWKSGLSTAASGVMLFSLLQFAAPMAQAEDYPPDTLLQQLRARLIEPPRCAPQCATLADAQISAAADTVRVVLEVHALADLAVPIPGDEKSLTIASVSIDGVPRDAIVSQAGHSWVAVDRGVHRVEIAYGALGDRVALAFPMAPERIEVSATGWQASGIADDRLLTETLTLVRARTGVDLTTVAAAQRFPPFVRVDRVLNLDLEWSIDATVERLAPREGGFTVMLPILDGEHVSTGGLKVRDGKLTIALADRQSAASWHSTLDQVDTLTLTAPDLDSHAEVWRIVSGPTWHVEFSGIPETPSARNGANGDFHVFEFHPLPGETLKLHVIKPGAIDGATRAIDSLNLTSEFGLRARTHTLQFDARASQGGEQVVVLPADAELLGVSRDGQAIGARLLDRKLSLPLNPGQQKYEVRFRENTDMASRIRTPEISLGLPAANITLAAIVSDDRWLLAAFGPPVGPAVLFWGELLVAMALAWLLSRWRGSPLRLHHWLLLVLGFSTFSWLALVVVVVWLFALDWRARNTPETNWKFNLAQLALAGLTLIALICLFESIRNGLLGSPDMVVRGNDSWANHLQWFADRSVDALPTASVISLPLWVYNIVMLFWALWLAWAVVGWLRNGFSAWTSGGYWRPWRVEKTEQIELPPSAPPPPGP